MLQVWSSQRGEGISKEPMENQWEMHPFANLGGRGEAKIVGDHYSQGLSGGFQEFLKFLTPT